MAVAHSKIAAGADQAGSAPHRQGTPLRSPHFLVAVTPVDCATGALSTLLPVQYVVQKDFDEANLTAMCQLCEDDAKLTEMQRPTAGTPHGPTRWDMVIQEGFRDAQMIHCDSVRLFRNMEVSRAAQRRGSRLRRRRRRRLCQCGQL